MNYRFWWLVHNSIAHFLLGLHREWARADQFHDWSWRKMEAAPEIGPGCLALIAALVAIAAMIRLTILVGPFIAMRLGAEACVSVITAAWCITFFAIRSLFKKLSKGQ